MTIIFREFRLKLVQAYSEPLTLLIVSKFMPRRSTGAERGVSEQV